MEHSDSTRIACSDRRLGSIQPAVRADLLRDVYLASGARIEGAVWANRLFIEGPSVSVRDAIFARGSIRIDPSPAPRNVDDVIDLGSAVATADSLVIAPDAGRIRVRSNIYANAVNLRNCVVYGNIYAEHATLTDCAVVGGIYASGALHLERCVAGTFVAGGATLKKRVAMLLPCGVAKGQISLQGLVTWELLARTFEATGEPATATVMEESDILRVDELGIPSPDGDHRMLSVAFRLLDASSLTDAIAESQTVCTRLSLDAHVPKEFRATGQALDDVERKLFALVQCDPDSRRAAKPVVSLSDIAQQARDADVAKAFADLSVSGGDADGRTSPSGSDDVLQSIRTLFAVG